jgi:predicted enzyme related to lactoylglutathione lyase
MSNEQAPAAIGRLENVTIDCRDPRALAEFWGSVLGVGIGGGWGPYVFLEKLPSGLELAFQRVAEPKSAKNRLHLDVRVLEMEAASRRVVELGGQVVGDVDDEGHGWRVMLDPEGNEFCLLRPRPL